MIEKNIFSRNGALWPDNNGVHLNAHGGCVVKFSDTWYWYGEHKIAGKAGNRAHSCQAKVIWFWQ